MSKTQLDLYIKNQKQLLEKFENKVIAVKDGVCIGDFESKLEAYRFVTAKGYKEGEYMIVECTKGDSGYTAYFANWFVFAGQKGIQSVSV